MLHTYSTRSNTKKEEARALLRTNAKCKAPRQITFHCVHIPTRGTFTYTDNDIHHVKSNLHNILDLIEESDFNIHLLIEFFEYVWSHPYIISLYKSFSTIIQQKAAELKHVVASHANDEDYQKLHDILSKVETIL